MAPAAAIPPAVPDRTSPVWPCRPAIGGDWRPMSGDQARALVQAVSAHHRPGHLVRISGGRGLDILCLPGWQLGEVLVGFTGGALGIARFLYCGADIMPIDGSDAPFRLLGGNFHAVGENGLRQYLDLFTSMVRSGSDAFHLVPRPGPRQLAIEWRDELAPADVSLSRAARLWRCKALVAFRTDLYAAEFTIDALGVVDLVEDRHVSEICNPRRTVFDGMWQIPRPS